MTEVKVRYTLNCQGCGCPFYSDTAFPEPQYCLECKTIFDKGKQEGREEVVKFVIYLITHLDSQFGFIRRLDSSSDWSAKLKEWGLL